MAKLIRVTTDFVVSDMTALRQMRQVAREAAEYTNIVLMKDAEIESLEPPEVMTVHQHAGHGCDKCYSNAYDEKER